MPEGDGFLFEPKWDGFRAIVFRGADDIYIQSRDLRPLDRYFPELHDALIDQLPPIACRRRDRHHHTARPGFRRAATAPASGGVARRQAGAGTPLVVRGVRPAGRGRRESLLDRTQRDRRQILERCSHGAPRPSISRR